MGNSGDSRSDRLRSGSGSTVLEAAVLVTGNHDKVIEARRLCGENLSAVEIELPEIQSMDILEVLRHKSDEADRYVTGPFIVEETSLELDSMNGFPGPLVKWMLDATGAETMAHIATLLKNDRGTARCCLLYRDGAQSVFAEGSTTGRLVLPPRGTNGFGWDPVFVPDGEMLTYAELQPSEKDSLSHRGRAWRELARKLAGLPKTGSA